MFPLLKILGVSMLAIGLMEPARAFENISGFEEFPVVADRELDQMRGGFETASGGLPLSFSFGIERVSFVNGQLVATSILAIPSLAELNSGAARAAGLDPITVIQTGPGNTFARPGIRDLPSQFMTLIQNTLDNQAISNVTVINASATSRDFLRSLALQNSLNRMTFSSFH
ncbi:MAG: hypothetical protein Q8L69_06270 [Gallionellaceae bacterium]|nr:hypothetical protein [Gallionellaceae bacterium]